MDAWLFYLPSISSAEAQCAKKRRKVQQIML